MQASATPGGLPAPMTSQCYCRQANVSPSRLSSTHRPQSHTMAQTISQPLGNALVTAEFRARRTHYY
ncbi:uncharacterized protein SCHCODRAFT_02618158 [Schizophyllum commune H4-8]|uniref:uncharacterized protein n=1 Tax=Schizophyllum commune (strain H4-8 / FGSC 9210) TaxID=578458 RepID=UPI00215EF418|nr:uncharacterized protein SCHCODRAFT_02618158 [Schizophyllum commune H4-8]KAI5894941.1 hypothetical protein SCHCODRAFT_02618158 [Schizophyllum commune H4-8]